MSRPKAAVLYSMGTNCHFEASDVGHLASAREKPFREAEGLSSACEKTYKGIAL